MRRLHVASLLVAVVGCRTSTPDTTVRSTEVGNSIGSQVITIGDGYFLSDFAGQPGGVEAVRKCLKFAPAAQGASLGLTDEGDGAAAGDEATRLSDDVPPASPDQSYAKMPFGSLVTTAETVGDEALEARAVPGGQASGLRLADGDEPSTTSLAPSQVIGNQDTGYFFLTSSRAVDTAVDVGVKVGVKTPMVKVDVDSQTNVNTSSQSSSVHFVIYSQFLKRATTVDTPVLRDDIAEDVIKLVEGKPRIDTQKFFQRCGHALVSQVVFGAKIAAQLSVTSASSATQVKQALNVDVKYGNKLTRKLTSVDVNTAINVGVNTNSSSQSVSLRVKASGIPEYIVVPSTEVVKAQGVDALINLVNDSIKNRQDLGVAYGVLNAYGNIRFKYQGKYYSDFVDSPLTNGLIQIFLRQYKAETARVNDALLALADVGVTAGGANATTLAKVQDYQKALDEKLGQCLAQGTQTTCAMPADGLAGLEASLPQSAIFAFRVGTGEPNYNQPHPMTLSHSGSAWCDKSENHRPSIEEVLRILNKNTFWQNLAKGSWSDQQIWTSTFKSGKRQSFSVPRYLSGQDPAVEAPGGAEDKQAVICVCNEPRDCY